MEWDYDLSFQEKMEAGRDAAARAAESRAYIGGRVTWRRREALVLSTAECAKLWKVTEAQVKLVLKRGGIPGAKRARKGRGRPWIIPYRLVEGKPVVGVEAPSRGITAGYVTEGTIPF